MQESESEIILYLVSTFNDSKQTQLNITKNGCVVFQWKQSQIIRSNSESYNLT